MKRGAVLLFAVFLMSGCASLNPFQGVSNPPAQPKKMGAWEQTSRPVIVGTTADGKTVVANELTYRASAEETLPKPSIWRRVMALGWGWVALMIAGLFFPPIAMIMGVVNRGLGFGVKQVVTGVQHGLDSLEENRTYTGKEVRALLTSKLENAADESTKKLVKTVKKAGIPPI